MADLRTLVRHPASLTFVGTVLGYGILLAVMAALVFALPFLIFRLL